MDRDAYLEKTAQIIKDKSKGKEIVCWGYAPDFVEKIKEYGIYIIKIFTRKKNYFDKGCVSFEELQKLAGLAFVVFPNSTKLKESVDLLKKWGFEDTDYYSLYPEKRIIIKQTADYEDDHGNQVAGYDPQISLDISGYNNYVKIGKNIKVINKFIIHIDGNNNNLVIGDNCVFGGGSSGSDNVQLALSGKYGANVNIEANVNMKRAFIGIRSYSDLNIGRNTTFRPGFLCIIDAYSSVKIGKDCMFSGGCVIQSSDGHSIFNVNTGKNINSILKDDQKYVSEIDVGDHVWIGRDCMILGTTKIGEGTIVGARSTVKGNYPNNVIIAGSIARIIAKDRAWSRVFMSDDISDCEGYDKKTVETFMVD